MTSTPLRARGEDALRWIVLLPVSLFAAWAAWLLTRLINLGAIRSQGVDLTSFWGRFALETTPHMVLGAAGVWVAVIIAPTYKVRAASATGVLYAVAAGFLAFPAIMMSDWWSLIGAACIVLGVSAILWAIYTGQVIPVPPSDDPA
jgi:hypothetical protein